MSASERFLVGEFTRTVDDRWRLSLPPELADGLCESEDEECMLVKERLGALSLWNAKLWRDKIERGIEVVKSKMQARRLEGRLADVQQFGRLLSSRYGNVRMDGRFRLLIPDGFREFLGVEPNSEVMVVGAAVCVEIWHPQAWKNYLKRRMPKFGTLFEELSA